MSKYCAIVIVVILTLGCSKKITTYSGDAAFKSENREPNYAELKYWAAHPGKKDPSDTVPKMLKQNEKEKQADVFFLHPTTLTGIRENGNDNAAIDDAAINYKTDYSPIIYQSTAFNANARIYAPRYRQAHIGMYSEKDSASKYKAFNLAYQDVKNAFEYYLKYENKGRPIVIASHSQGTTHAKRLLKEYFDGKMLSKQLVCAYLIGMEVKKNEYVNIPVCKDSIATGCFVSWRTYRDDYIGTWINKTDSTIAVVNPATWTSSSEWVPKDQHKGAVLYNLNKVYNHTQSSKVEGNALWVTHPKFPGSFLFRSKNYHAGDINLFYVDVRQNVSMRIEQYLKKK